VDTIVTRDRSMRLRSATRSLSSDTWRSLGALARLRLRVHRLEPASRAHRPRLAGGVAQQPAERPVEGTRPAGGPQRSTASQPSVPPPWGSPPGACAPQPPHQVRSTSAR